MRQADGQDTFGLGHRTCGCRASGERQSGKGRSRLSAHGAAPCPYAMIVQEGFRVDRLWGGARGPAHCGQRRLSSNRSSWSPRAAIGLADGLCSACGSTALAPLASQSSRWETRTQAAASQISLGCVVTARHGLTDSVELAAAGVSIPRAHIMCPITDVFKVMCIPPTRRWVRPYGLQVVNRDRAGGPCVCRSSRGDRVRC